MDAAENMPHPSAMRILAVLFEISIRVLHWIQLVMEKLFNGTNLTKGIFPYRWYSRLFDYWTLGFVYNNSLDLDTSCCLPVALENTLFTN